MWMIYVVEKKKILKDIMIYYVWENLWLLFFDLSGLLMIMPKLALDKLLKSFDRAEFFRVSL